MNKLGLKYIWHVVNVSVFGGFFTEILTFFFLSGFIENFEERIFWKKKFDFSFVFPTTDSICAITDEQFLVLNRVRLQNEIQNNLSNTI